MNPADEEFDPCKASDEELTLFLARQGISPVDLQRSLEKTMQKLVWWRLRDERPWEEFELDRLDADGH
jgi:hypothetical protein